MPRTYSELYISVRNRLRDAGIEAAELEGKLIVATAAGKTTEKLLRDMRFMRQTRWSAARNPCWAGALQGSLWPI